MGVVWITIIAFLAICQASPLPHKVKYHQQQEGKLNVRADLENFIFLIMPITRGSSAANGSLLQVLSKTIPLVPYFKKPKKHLKHHPADDNLPDTEQFIESKTAPYHVDISRAKNHLAKLHPQVTIPENIKEEIIIARSPSVALSKDQQLRSSRAILISVPMENEFIQRHSMKDVIGGKGNEEIKKSVGLTIEAVEEGLQLADEMQNPMKETKNKIEIIEVITEKPHKTYAAKLEEIAEEMKKNETVNKAVVMAKVIQAGLVEYFRKVAEKFKEQADKHIIEEDEPKVLDNLKQKGHKITVGIKEKNKDNKENKEKTQRGLITKKIEEVYEKVQEEAEKVATPSMPKVELQPPKMPEEQMENNINKEHMEKPAEELSTVNKESSKEELLLLGAENEQCGPGQERDSSGICTLINKS